MQKKAAYVRRTAKMDSKRTTVGRREKRRFVQLLICLIIFLIVIIGKGNIPKDTLQYIHTNADFKGALSELGEAVSKGEPILQAFGTMFLNVFSQDEQVRESVQIANITHTGVGVQSAVRELSKKPDRNVILSRLGVQVEAIEADLLKDEEGMEKQVEPELLQSVEEYVGPELPENATMEYVALELDEIVTPVMGEITSLYGYRDHPINGEYLFHTGVDLAADSGTPIAAFAAGKVDYIGESDAYGLYLQIEHGNGITTFYCHCKEICVRKGETVSAGQIIALVGDTGNATGAHLHLELERNGVLLNPAYYIQIIE